MLLGMLSPSLFVGENKDTPHYRLMVLLEQELPECTRREKLDEIANKFCTNHGSNKNSRKRLLNTLFLVPRSRLDLLPYYARMAAILDRVWTDIGPPLVKELEQQFHGQTKFKKNQNIEARLRTVRYIGELTKFRVAPPIIFLRCIQRCLDDFTGNNVLVACSLIESTGRYLYRVPLTHTRIANTMETISRLSKAKNLDERLQLTIKAAFYSVKPPPSGPQKKAKVYPPLETYLRYLLMSKLTPSSSSCSFVSKQIARLPWSDSSQQCGALVCRLMLKASLKGRYKTLEAIATVAANLRSFRFAGEATVRLVDSVLEELRWALDKPDFRDQQRTITYARLLGELFCAGQVSPQVIFTQLYDFINLGHEIPEALREASKKLNYGESTRDSDTVQLHVYDSSGAGVSQAIQEEEEMKEDDLQVKESDAEKPAEVMPVAVSEYSLYDPRVPAPLQDPPTSSYRVKLVCTLLEVVAKNLTTPATLPRLRGFLTAFQRYLFTKTMLPTDVEFSLLDTFDAVDSHSRSVAKTPQKRDGTEDEAGFPRFTSWRDAHNSTVAIEESEAILEKQRQETLASGAVLADDEFMDDDDDDTASLLDDEASVMLDDDEEEMDEERVIEGHYDDGEVAEDDDGETDSEGDEDYFDDEEEEEFDAEVHMRQLEEEAFERELRLMTMDALEKGKSASRKLVADYMPSGSHTIRKKTDAAPPAFGGKPGISFQVLKRGNKGKVEAKELVVPVDNNLAIAVSRQDDAAARERDEIKRRVLLYEAESAESELYGGNVYLEQEKLQVIRNKPLSMADIDKNFGTSGGSRQAADSKPKQPPQRGYSGRGNSGRGPARGLGGGRGRGPTGAGRGTGRGR